MVEVRVREDDGIERERRRPARDFWPASVPPTLKETAIKQNVHVRRTHHLRARNLLRRADGCIPWCALPFEGAVRTCADAAGRRRVSGACEAK
jgi:hypothetical protein